MDAEPNTPSVHDSGSYLRRMDDPQGRRDEESRKARSEASPKRNGSSGSATLLAGPASGSRPGCPAARSE